MKKNISLKELISNRHYKINEMTVKTFHFNPLQVNTYVLHDETKQAIIIDPGNFESWEDEQLKEYIEQQQLSVQFVVNTHPHVDHICGNKWCAEQLHCPIYIHEKALKIYNQAAGYGYVMGMDVENSPKPSKLLQDGDVLSFGQQHLQVLYTPGHADGSICLYDAANHMVFVGDVLFYGTVGRTDFPTGSLPLLVNSINEKLWALPDETTVFCGHAINTTIGHEKLYNSFI